jgi:hypothetical protein
MMNIRAAASAVMYRMCKKCPIDGYNISMRFAIPLSLLVPQILSGPAAKL